MGYTTKFSGSFTLDRKEVEALRRPLAPAENEVVIACKRFCLPRVGVL